MKHSGIRINCRCGTAYEYDPAIGQCPRCGCKSVTMVNCGAPTRRTSLPGISAKETAALYREYRREVAKLGKGKPRSFAAWMQTAIAHAKRTMPENGTAPPRNADESQRIIPHPDKGEEKEDKP
jgi:hypothetical protein